MFVTNEPNVQSSKHSSDPKARTMSVDNEVRSAVALEFSRMDELHSRIRKEALSPIGSATQSEPMNDQKLA